MSYRLDYSANHPEQIVQDGASVAAPAIRYVEVPRRGFTFPSILKTTAVFLTGAAALFTWETAAPEGYRISTSMGTYDARIAAAVKAAELQQPSRFDSWAANVKLAADQQSQQYKAITEGVLTNYTPTYEQHKIAHQHTNKFQGHNP